MSTPTVSLPVGSSFVRSAPQHLLAYARTPDGQKMVRFASVSAVAIVVSQVTLAIMYGPLGFDESRSVIAQLAAFFTSTIASYVLNRRWVWGRSGRSDFLKEVVPFWGIGLVQLAMSVPFVQWGRHVLEAEFSSRLVRTVGFLALNLFVYGVMWVGKYVFFNRVLFADNETKPAV